MLRDPSNLDNQLCFNQLVPAFHPATGCSVFSAQNGIQGTPCAEKVSHCRFSAQGELLHRQKQKHKKTNSDVCTQYLQHRRRSEGCSLLSLSSPFVRGVNNVIPSINDGFVSGEAEHIKISLERCTRLPVALMNEAAFNLKLEDRHRSVARE